MLPRPARPVTQSRRATQAWAQQCQAVALANDAIQGVQQLEAGRLDDRLLGNSTDPRQLCQDPVGRAAAEHIALICSRRLPPVGRPQGDAAIQRLQGDRASRPAFPRHHANCFEEVTTKLLKENNPAALPKRGDQFPAHWASVALPPPGTTPVSMRDVSPRVADYLDNMLEKMIHPDRAQKMADCGIAPYTDPHFQNPDNLLELAKRMAAGGMLRAVPEARGSMPLFTVVKKAALHPDRCDVSLRLIFDLRLENEGWRDAPWCGLGGVSSLSYLDVSQELRDGFSLLYAVGDVPDYFYMLEIPEQLSEHFALPGISATALRAALDPGVSLPGTGDVVGCRVLPMGYKWSVYLAQTVLEDVFEHGGARIPELNVSRRVMEGAALPQITEAEPVVYYNYVDDYGIIGIGPADVPAEAHPVEKARRDARSLLQACGFSVHEACSQRERMIGGDFEGSELIPNQDKLWAVIEAAQAICRRRSRPPWRPSWACSLGDS